MASVNKIILIGNIGRVEVKTFQDGAKVVECSLATSERYKDRNGNDHDDTQWHRLVIGGKLADVAEKFVQKGDPLYVEGKMKYRKYSTRDGVEKEVAEVQVQALQLLPKGMSEKKPQDQQSGSQANPHLRELMDKGEDDLPFE